jgi:hypothetical protein
MSFSLSSCRGFVFLVLAGLGACDAVSTNDYGKQNLHYPDAGGPLDAGALLDAGPLSCEDAGALDAGHPACDLARPTAMTCAGAGPMEDACNSPANPCLGRVTGKVSIPDGIKPGHNHPPKGTLLVALLKDIPTGGCPDGSSKAPPVPFVAIHCADLSPGKEVDFAIEGVPVGESWSYVAATLDVNANGSDACDLLGATFEAGQVSRPGATVKLQQTVGLSIGLDSRLPASCSTCN